MEKENKLEELKNRLEPFLQQFDEALQYLQSRRDMYEKCNVPIEDTHLRKLVFKITRFSKRVEQDLAFQSHRDRAWVTIQEIIDDQQVGSTKSHIRHNRKGQSKQTVKINPSEIEIKSQSTMLNIHGLGESMVATKNMG